MTSTSPRLTAKDHIFLESLLQARDHDDAYLALLRQKLDAADVVLAQMIDPRTATIDSRIAFSVGGGSTEQRVLTRDEKATVAGGSPLPVTTLRGLALLGLSEGDVFPLRKPNGIIEPLRLEKVCYQPESAMRRPDPEKTVVAFPPLSSAAARGGSAHAPDDDDPGPRAA